MQCRGVRRGPLLPALEPSNASVRLAKSSPIPYDMRAMNRALLAFCVLFATPSAYAQTPKTVFLEELTWTELQNRVRSGKTTVIVPIGGTEQNGPHIVLGKHNMRVKALSEKIALALGDALVAPVLAYVPEGRLQPPTAHMRFPGTITVPGRNI